MDLSQTIGSDSGTEPIEGFGHGLRPTETHLARLETHERSDMEPPRTPRSPCHPPTMSSPVSGVEQRRVRYSSPTQASSSITPPPSSRAHLWKPGRSSQLPASEGKDTTPCRTPTMSASLLSSPPPTVGRPSARALSHVDLSRLDIPCSPQSDDATPMELRLLVGDLKTEITKLAASLMSARTAAAHYKLQYNLLSIESEEAARCMAVEQEMSRREVEVLQKSSLGFRQLQRLQEVEMVPLHAREPAKPSSSTLELEQQCRSLWSENGRLRRRLRRAKKLLRYREGETQTLQRDRDRLRQRIRENRDHLNQFRQAHALFEGSTPLQANSLATTPQQQHQRGTAEPRTAHRPSTRTGGQDTFAALLLADQVLSQEHARTHPASTRGRGLRQGHLGHSRGTQSLSSLPATSSFLQPTASVRSKVPRPYPFQDISAHLVATLHAAPPLTTERRRSSRDSTISASDIESNPVPDFPGKQKVDIVPESQASQLAAHLLRHSPPMARDHGRSSVEPSRRSAQLKSQGPGKKASTSSRGDGTSKWREEQGQDRNGDSTTCPPVKRLKTGEGFGLGIGACAGANGKDSGRQ